MILYLPIRGPPVLARICWLCCKDVNLSSSHCGTRLAIPWTRVWRTDCRAEPPRGAVDWRWCGAAYRAGTRIDIARLAEASNLLVKQPGYTIDRAIRGPEQRYNDIAQWNWITIIAGANQRTSGIDVARHWTGVTAAGTAWSGRLSPVSFYWSVTAKDGYPRIAEFHLASYPEEQHCFVNSVYANPELAISDELLPNCNWTRTSDFMQYRHFIIKLWQFLHRDHFLL